MTNNKEKQLREKFANETAPVRRKDINAAGAELGMSEYEVWKVVKTLLSAGKRGYFYFKAPATEVSAPAEKLSAAKKFKLATSVASVVDDEIYIPKADPTYVKWGEYKTVLSVIESGHFFPLYISGMSGNGKTFMVEQATAKAKREYIRVQISPETDEDDLIGGFRLIDGETIFQKGPVIKAMERGAILLIDEIDRATNKIMCLQGVLEGNPVLLKKTGEVINPAPGFNVIATANTKGRGSDDGRYSAASIIDDAFLERFVASIDQAYAPSNVEKTILTKHAAKYDVDDSEFIEKLVSWSTVIRKTFEDDAIDEVVSTRRLCHIVKTHSVFNDRAKSIELCINRFDDETKTAFLDLYTKIDESAEPITLEEAQGTPLSEQEVAPF
jgi:hypothetical protein|tara:strand:+ start:829 stop:1983 length:1155 start_codon:yes stop_codon:yes gene_type:complete